MLGIGNDIGLDFHVIPSLHFGEHWFETLGIALTRKRGTLAL